MISTNSQPVSVGDMRWLVTLANRAEAPSGSVGITETITTIATVYAAIQPMGLQTFLSSEQIDTPITHSVYFRWQPFASLQMFNVVLRTLLLPDASSRTETFRIRRAQEWEGRQRYIRLDVEFESYAAISAPILDQSFILNESLLG